MNVIDTGIQQIKKLTPKQISILLTIVALIIWSFSLTQTKLGIDSLGIFKSFPIWYFVGLGILTIAAAILWVSKENHTKLLFLQFILLFISIRLIPIIIGGFEPANQDVFRLLSESVGYLANHTQIVPGTVYYHEWPAYAIFLSSVFKVTGVTLPFTGVLLSTFIIQLIQIPIWYYVFRELIPEDRRNFAWAAIWLLYLGFWAGEPRFAPQGIALGILFVILVIFLKRVTNKDTQNRFGWRITLVILGVILVLTHALTSIVLILILIMFTITRRASLVKYIILFFTFLVAWMMHLAEPVAGRYFSDIMRNIFKIESIYQASLGGRLSGNEVHVFINQLRVVLSAIYFFMAGLGFLLALRLKKRNPVDISMMVVLGSLVLMLPMFMYGGSILIRMFAFAVIPLSYFAIKLLDKRVGVVIILILVMLIIPLQIITHYGNYPIDNIPPQEITGTEFVDKYAGDYYLSDDLLYPNIDFPPTEARTSGRLRFHYEDIIWEDKQLTRRPRMFEDISYLIVTGQYTQDYYNYRYNSLQLILGVEDNLSQSTNANYVFTNNTFGLYVNEGTR